MTLLPRFFDTYAAGLTVAYEEEISGESFFATLAGFHSGRAAEALHLIVAIEQAMARALQPLIALRGLTPKDRATLLAEGIIEAEHLRDVPWADHLRTKCATYGAYVAEFEAVLAQSPKPDHALIRLLVDHEVAFVAFAKAELAGDPDSLAPLHACLKRLTAPPT